MDDKLLKLVWISVLLFATTLFTRELFYIPHGSAKTLQVMQDESHFDDVPIIFRLVDRLAIAALSGNRATTVAAAPGVGL